jgi:hypothetical protein
MAARHESEETETQGRQAPATNAVVSGYDFHFGITSEGSYSSSSARSR